MARVTLLPVSLDKTTAPERLAGDVARSIRNADTMRRVGRVIRGKGLIRTERAVSSDTITAAGVFRDPYGNYVPLDRSDAGSVVIVPPNSAGTGAGGRGPRQEWEL